MSGVEIPPNKTVSASYIKKRFALHHLGWHLSIAGALATAYQQGYKKGYRDCDNLHFD